MTGSGTEQDPYIIENVTDLQAMEDDLDAYYELGGDIDASATSGWNGGAGFDPIGEYGGAGHFSGHFDGKGYTISDLYINRPTESYVGLFGNVAPGVYIGNVHFTSPTVHGLGQTGVLAGALSSITPDCTVEHCSATDGDVSGDGRCAGLIGDSGEGNVTDCHFQGSLTFDNGPSAGGGLVGHSNGVISECSATISMHVDGDTRYVGGLVGRSNGAVRRSFAKGSINAYDTTPHLAVGPYVAGLVGLSQGSIYNSYSRVNVIGSQSYGYAAGLLGWNWGATVDNCYSTGVVSFGAQSGGLVARVTDGGTTTDSFWDTETSGQSSSYGGTGKTTAEMKTKSTFTDAGWNFTTIWDIDGDQNDGYPYLIALPTQPSIGGYLWIESTELAYTDANGIKRTKEGTQDGATGQTAGHGWIEGNNFRYIDSSGNERYITGTLDGATGASNGLWIEGTKLRYIDSSGNERYIEGTT